tara:strand:+ start:8707 stop:8964 length:258 start_codon:yes stop_codon:yes gene_type:complete
MEIRPVEAGTLPEHLKKRKGRSSKYPFKDLKNIGDSFIVDTIQPGDFDRMFNRLYSAANMSRKRGIIDFRIRVEKGIGWLKVWRV